MMRIGRVIAKGSWPLTSSVEDGDAILPLYRNDALYSRGATPTLAWK
jgi:hypothetical protein